MSSFSTHLRISHYMRVSSFRLRPPCLYSVLRVKGPEEYSWLNLPVTGTAQAGWILPFNPPEHAIWKPSRTIVISLYTHASIFIQYGRFQCMAVHIHTMVLADFVHKTWRLVSFPNLYWRERQWRVKNPLLASLNQNSLGTGSTSICSRIGWGCGAGGKVAVGSRQKDAAQGVGVHNKGF